MSKPILYYKPTCGWCHEAMDFFKKHRIELELRDIAANPKYRAELENVSGQGFVPTLKMGDFIVKDFGVDELLVALDKNPSAKKELGL